jgi:hypothetical protein
MKKYLFMALLLGCAALLPAQGGKSADRQAAEKRLAQLQAEMAGMRQELTEMKRKIEVNGELIAAETAKAKSSVVRNYGRRAYAKNRLSLMRTALQLYYADTEGEFPASLGALVPAYLAEVPEIELPGYAKTRGVITVKSSRAPSPAGLVSDTGGWLYVTDKASPLAGKVFIDSRGKEKGKFWYDY